MAEVETQSYLDEMKTPSLINQAAVRTAIKIFAQKSGDVQRQASHLAQLLQDAEIAEPDAVLRGKFEEAFQLFGALERQTAELRRALRQVVGVYRRLKTLDAEMRTLAAALGYTV